DWSSDVCSSDLGVVHHEHHRAELEAGVQVALHELDVAQELPQALQRVVLALDGNEHLAGGGEAVDRQETEGRWAVDEDVVVVVAHAVERAAEAHLPAEGGDQLDLGPSEVERRRSAEQVADSRRLDAVLDGEVVE